MENVNKIYADEQQLARSIARFELSQKAVEDLTAMQKALNSRLSSSTVTHSDLQHQLAEAQVAFKAALMLVKISSDCEALWQL
jgi:hypothetical protein